MRRIISRDTLRNAVLSSARQHGLTLVTAPVGSGKTILLNQIQDCLNTEEAMRCNAPAVTVIDDFSRGTRADRSEQARQIEARLDEGQRFILASDQKLDGLFGKSRVRGEVMEFSLEDLALRDTELDDFLGEELSQGVTSETRRILMEHTQGWIGAWNILRTQLSKGMTPVDLARSFSGRHRDLVAYFDQVVMPELSADLVGFLYDTAPLEELCEAYVRAATGRPDCAAMIRMAAQECGFLLDRARNGTTFRLFRLFKEYLVGQAKLADSVRYASLACRAAEHALAQSDWLVAARLFVEAGETDRTLEIVRQYADDLLMGLGEIHGFRRLLASLPQEHILRSSLSIQQALGSVLKGDYSGAAVILDKANADSQQTNEADRARRAAIGIGIDFGLEHFQQVQTEAPRWLELRGAGTQRLGNMVAAALFLSCVAMLDNTGACNALGVVRKFVERSRSGYLESWFTIMSAIYALEQGKVAGAAELLEGSVDTGSVHHTVNLIRASVAFEQGQFAQARRLIDLSLHLGTRHTIVETSLRGWETAARLMVRDQGLVAAVQWLERIEALAATRHGERARRLVRLRRATLILQESGDGRHPELQSELEEMLEDPLTANLCPSFSEELRLTLARCYVIGGKPRRAIVLVQPIQAAAQRSHRIGHWSVASLIYGGALARLDELGRGTRQVWTALTRMVEGGYLTSATSEHILLAPFLETLEKRVGEENNGWSAALRNILTQLSARAGRSTIKHPAEGSYAAHPPAFIALTESERNVLSLAAQGRSNAEIAESLLISVTTAKWHMKNVFVKLSVHSRTAAIAHARRQGIAI